VRDQQLVLSAICVFNVVPGVFINFKATHFHSKLTLFNLGVTSRKAIGQLFWQKAPVRPLLSRATKASVFQTQLITNVYVDIFLHAASFR